MGYGAENRYSVHLKLITYYLNLNLFQMRVIMLISNII